MLTYLWLAQCSFFYLCFVWAVAKSSCQVMWFFIYFFLLSCLFHKLTCFLTERTATISGAFRHECWSYSSASLLFMHLLVGLFKHPRKRWKTFFRWHVVYLLFVVIHCYLRNPVLYIFCCLIVLLCDICESTSRTFMIIYWALRGNVMSQVRWFTLEHLGMHMIRYLWSVLSYY